MYFYSSMYNIALSRMNPYPRCLEKVGLTTQDYTYTHLYILYKHSFSMRFSVEQKSVPKPNPYT